MNMNNTAVYNLIKPSKIVAELPYLFAFNVLLAACSYISINLPFSPVPITGQTFGVLLIAMTLGKVRGTAVVGAYLFEGACGPPVFAGGSTGLIKFMGPTGGYLIGFVPAVYLVGYLSERGWTNSFTSAFLTMIIGTLIIFIFGISWLAVTAGFGTALSIGLYPYIPGAVIKIILATVTVYSINHFNK